jgi:tRNA-2-methylthio-N6-dimethylallyladenosine synthase
MSKKLYIETLGCAMNVRDSEHIVAELTTKKEYKTTNNIEDADLIIINTCSVREKPVSKLFSEIGMFKKQKKDGAKIGVCGCTASHLGDEIIKKAPSVNFVLGARNVSKISEIVDKNRAVEVDINHDESTYAFNEFRESLYKAYINISIGCDKQCTFCIVPNTRGEEISIPLELIVAEAKKAVDKGAKEIFLLGQNVNNYGKKFSDGTKGIDFVTLLKEVSKIDGVRRIRFTSPHPLHMDDEFIEEFASNPKICKSIHMPLQSGSSKVLKDMKRGYTKEWFVNRAKKIRELVTDVSISTDIIVGFPDESDSDFEDTMDIMKEIKFEQIFSFKYSPRPNTQSLNMKNRVEDKIASSRLSRVIDKHKQDLDDITTSQIGKIHIVLFEELKVDGYVFGKSDNNFTIKVKGSQELLGEIKEVKIIASNRMYLEGEIVERR